MSGPRIMTTLVVIVMLFAFSYVVWTSRQAAHAHESNDLEKPGRVERLHQAIEQADWDLSGS